LTYLTIGKIKSGKQSLLIQKTVSYNRADCLQKGNLLLVLLLVPNLEVGVVIAVAFAVIGAAAGVVLAAAA
jgi:hypothetical protein